MPKLLNPYRAGKPIDDDNGFIGREDILNWVAQELRNQNTNCLVLFGQRRIGKTTLLLKLERFLPKEEYLPIVFDLQYQAQQSLGQLLYDLSCIMAERANLEQPHEDKIIDERGDLFKKDFLPNYVKSLHPQLRPILLFDEFDVFEKTSDNSIANTAGKTLFPFLANLMRDFPQIGFIFVAGRSPHELSLNYNTIFKQALVNEVWVLDRTSSEKLIRQAEENQTLTFSNSAIERIIEITNGHPYLTQLLCQRIWERAYITSPNSLPKIEVNDVELATADALAVGSAALEWWWNGLLPAERVYASALAENAMSNQAISEDKVIDVLSTNASRLRSRQVELAPKDLVKRRVLVNVGEREYKFAIEMLGSWIRKNRSLAIVKEELDQVNEPANQLYEIGRSYYQRRKLDEARANLETAINENPQHLNAHLLLGDVFLEIYENDSAIRILENAYKLDRSEARLPLARAWITKASFLISQKKLDDALVAADKALEYSPNEKEAQSLKNKIWVDKGDKAWDRQDWVTAKKYYKEANDNEKVELVDEKIEYQKRMSERLSFLQSLSLSISRVFEIAEEPFQVVSHSLAKYIEYLNIQVDPESERRGLTIFSKLMNFLLLVMFVYADTILMFENAALYFPNTAIPPIYSNTSFAFLVSTIGVIVGVSVFFADITGISRLGRWHELKGTIRNIMIGLAIFALGISLLSSVVLSLNRLTNTPDIQISQTLANNILLLLSVTQSLQIVPLFIATFLFFDGVAGILVILVINIYVLRLIFNFLLYVLILTSRIFKTLSGVSEY